MQPINASKMVPHEQELVMKLCSTEQHSDLNADECYEVSIRFLKFRYLAARS